MELKIIESIQCGSEFLLKYKCPKCNKEHMEGFPIESLYCDYKEKVDYIIVPERTKRRLVSGTLRKNRPLSKKQILWLYQFQEEKCAYCERRLDSIYHVEHIIPVSVGGSNNMSNLVLSCPFCNLHAGSKVFNSFMDKKIYILNNKLNKS